MGLLISANLKQILLLFVIVQLVLLFPFFVHRKKFSFQWKNSTAATAERITFCPHLHFGWRGMCQRKPCDAKLAYAVVSFCQVGLWPPCCHWDRCDFKSINICFSLETPGSFRIPSQSRTRTPVSDCSNTCRL